MECLRVEAPAKINLTLEVLYRREDGFHQIRTILQELKLCDTLYLEVLPGSKIELCCTGDSAPWSADQGCTGGGMDHKQPALESGFVPGPAGLLPQGEGNLAYEAALLLQQRYAPQKGVRIKLIKRIPVAAGLGGGSSDAAAVLSGLNKLWGLSLKKEILQEMGAILGSDVPFFLEGGTALATGRGELVQALPPLPHTKVLLVSPGGLALSAAQVYSYLNLDKIPKENRTAQMVQLLRENLQDCAAIKMLLCNHLELSVFPLQKEVAALKEKLLHLELPALLSGSGPTVFALTKDEDRLQQVAAGLAAQGCSVVLTETI
ncbi:MAG: 4-(cytidine 5'-diphospho)-2-C-methyl-D-erythritol kinase [Dethiobacteria bacterium]|jgi:4-diphosphocytidyl-2-C-methyl-D-erythritol kinase